MRHILFLLFMAFTLQAIAQYPATGNKMRLGWQTTGDGLVYRGAIGDTATLDPSGINNAWMLLDTANGNLYAYRAKAWRLVSGGGGSVSDTLTGEVKGPLDSTYIDTVANIIFTTTTDTTVGVGELEYNDTQGSLIQGLKGGNVTNVIGQQIHQRVTNATGGPLTKGTAVFLHGSQGNRITVRKALATVDSTSANTFGIVAESIADNQSGYVITEGLITNMNTNALTEGAAVYLSPTVAGELTTTKPQAPQHTVYIGVCVKQNAGSGELFVKIRNGQELDELHDVRIDSLASNASLYYNAAQGVWRDTTGAVLTSDTAVFARDFQISGTANYLAKFTGSNAVGNSIAFETGGEIGIGTITPSGKVHISNAANSDPALRILSNSTTSGATHDAVNIDISPGSTSQSVAGVRVATVTAAEGSNTGYIARVNARNTSYGIYAEASKIWGSNLAGSATGVYGSGTTDSPSGFSYGGYFKNDTTQGTGFGVFVQTTTPKGSGTVTPLAIQHNSTELMRVQSSGNVGIATSSPSRPLHVAGTTAIRIPVGTTAQRPSDGANGDLRYSTTFNNIEFYDGSRGLWERPLVGTVATNKVAFASGDTLTSNTNFHWDNTNTKLGIGNAAPDSTLTVTGGIRATTGITAARFTATGSSVPTNGMYLPATNALAFSTNSTERMRILSDGKVGINVTPTEQLQVGGTVRATRVNVNTFSTQVLSINNYAPAGSQGYSLFIGDGGTNAVNTGAFAEEGARNLGIGLGALGAVTKGYYNLAIGTFSMASTTTGSNNVALGNQALYTNAGGSQNFGLGTGSLLFNVSGNDNIAIGHTSGYSSTGSNNIFIGTESFQAGTSGSSNTLIGYRAGFLNPVSVPITTMNNSTFIGHDTRAAGDNQTNQVVIGYNAVGNGSNTTTIGNNSTTKTFFQYGETYIGTATDNGAYNLQVAGGSYLSGEIKYVNRPAAAAVTNVGVDANGVLREATSSQRFKDNITPYQKGLSDAMRLQAKTYTYKGDTTLQAGFIAEDVHEAGLTEYVNYDKEGRPYSLQYGNMVTLLLNAMKEQQAQIEALKKEIEALKNK